MDRVELGRRGLPIYLIMASDPEVLSHEGFHNLFGVTLPPLSLGNADLPVPFGLLNITLARHFNVIQGVLPGSTPAMTYSDRDNEEHYFQLGEISFGSLPAAGPCGDGLDGNTWWPLFTNIPIEYVENYYPVVESYRSLLDSGRAGERRGENGIERIYRFDHQGVITIQDDRWRSCPCGVDCGLHGSPSSKLLVHVDSRQEALPSKCDLVEVGIGDRLILITAGAGDRAKRGSDAVLRDVRRGFASSAAALIHYGLEIPEKVTSGTQGAPEKH